MTHDTLSDAKLSRDKTMARFVLPVIFFITLFFTCMVPQVFSYSAFRKQFSNQEIELELDMYYSDIDYYISFTTGSIPFVDEESEIKIYRDMVTNPIPRFMLLELSVNPMPLLGVYIKKTQAEAYQKAGITNEFNVINSICSGFEEPYAASLFFGNVVSFRPKTDEKEEGKGYFGLLVSAGDYHIKDDELVPDKWLESELKIKGARITPGREMSWSFRAGTKFHGNTNIKDVVYFSLLRDRTDFDSSSISFFKNASLEYRADLDILHGVIIRHYFLLGKKIPLQIIKAALDLKAGFVWEGSDKYTGSLRRPGSGETFRIIFYPNIKF